MKLRDRVVVGFCLSLVLVTVLFVVDMQNESARRLSAADGDAAAAASHYHGRSDRSRDADEAQSAWNAAASYVVSTLIPSIKLRPTRPGAPQPYSRPADGRPLPEVTDLYAGDRFADLTERLSRSSETQRRRGYVTDWTAVRDVIVDDTDEDGTTSNEYVVEYLEDGLR